MSVFAKSMPLARSRRTFSGSTWVGLLVVAVFLLMAIGVWCQWWATDWWRAGYEVWLEPSSQHWFGTNVLGQDVFVRAVAATATAFEIGLLVAVVAVAVGAVLGAVAGYFSGRWPDHIVMWLVAVLDSMPFYLFAGALAMVLREQPWGIQVAMICTFWTMTARVVRAEVGRLAQRDFVLAARALGVPELSIVWRHLLPNVAHLILIQATILFVVAIKTEVVLSFLGFGSLERVSWGLMMAESTQEVTSGHLNNFIAATGFLCALVLAINYVSDALAEHLDVCNDN